MADAEGIILYPYFNDEGELNTFDMTDTLDSDFFSSLINAVSPLDRWFPIMGIKNVENTRAESAFQTYTDGSKRWLSQGDRTFKFLIPSPAGNQILLGKIEQLRCNEIGMFITDKNKQLIGMGTDEAFRGVRLNNESFEAILNFEVANTSAQGITVSFEFEKTEQDADLRVIAATEMDYDITLLRGLVDVNVEYSSISQTGVTITLSTDYGSLLNPVNVEGLVAGDFFSAIGGTASRLYNVTASANITIVTATEVSPGVYSLTFASQTGSDVIRVTPVKNGYDFVNVRNTTFTI